jgi:GNAT superfamily N-acetyltransferase
MAFLIRSFDERDFPAATAVAGAILPEQRRGSEGLGRWQEFYQAPDETAGLRRRYAVIDADTQQAIGAGALSPARAPKFRLHLMVLPGWQRRGAGSLLLERLLEDARSLGAATVQARAHDDQAETLAFFQKWGFVETQRMSNAWLNVDTADLSSVPSLLERLARHGVVITTLREEQERDDACLDKLHDLYDAVIPDWPDPDPTPGPVEPVSLDRFAHIMQPQHATPDVLFIAREGDRYVGFCGALGTAVRPVNRGQGIATALEAMMIELARRQGRESISGRSANPAMLAVYKKLGYQYQFSEVRLVKALQSAV